MIKALKQFIKILIMKNLSKLGKALTKQEQKSVIGGGPLEPFCGCSSQYFSGPGNSCVFPSPGGIGQDPCHGTIQNGQCCV